MKLSGAGFLPDKIWGREKVGPGFLKQWDIVSIFLYAVLENLRQRQKCCIGGHKLLRGGRTLNPQKAGQRDFQ